MALAATLLAIGDVSAFSRAYPIPVENKRPFEVVVEYSTYVEKAHALSPLWLSQKRERRLVGLVKLAPGQSKCLLGSEDEPWILWCQIMPPSSLPCEALDVRTSQGFRIIFDEHAI